MDYYPVRLQAAFFLAAIDISSKIKIANMVREKAGNLLEVDPLLLPLPVGSPPEFPHLVMRNESNGWTFQMAPARFDVTIERGPQLPHVDLRQLTSELSHTTLAIWQGMETLFKGRSTRVGLITTVVAEVDDPCRVFQTRFLNQVHGSGAHESQLHLLYKLDIEGFSVNRWVRLRALPPNDNWPSRLTVEVDVNSMGEQPIEVTETVAQSFISVATHLTGQTLGDYLAG